MRYRLNALGNESVRLLIVFALFLLFTVTFIMTFPDKSYAAVPVIIDGSQYPEDGAVGVPAKSKYVRVSFKSNPQGDIDSGTGLPENYLPIRPDTPSGSVQPKWKNIRVIELSTNTQVQTVDPLTGEPEVWFDDGTADGNDATLVIQVNPFDSAPGANNTKNLKPGQSYQVIIPQGSVEYANDSTADHNAEITWTFTVEQKPIPAVFSFQPGNQTFTLKNGQSTLPNRVDIHGVGYRKSLVVEFQNDIKSIIPQNTVVITGNELSASATPDTPNTDVMLDSIASNTLIVKLKHETPLKPNHLYTVTINANTLEDAEIDVQKYFSIPNSTTPTVPTIPAGYTDVRESDAVAYANAVINYVFDYIYAYLPTNQNDAYLAGNAAASVANEAYFLIDRVTSVNRNTYVTNLNNSLVTAVNSADIVNHIYNNSTRLPGNAATSANYPLKNDSYTIKFSTYRDFKATLIDPQTATITNINNTILKIEPPRRVGVVVPKKYITAIETIHYVQGLVPQNQGNNLTNIDITADTDVDRIIITTNRGPRVLTSKINNVFTAGYSGLEADGLTEIKIQAYDKYGQLLEDRSFKLGVDGTNPVKNDYIQGDPKVLGKTYTLYELMANPKLFAQILEHYPVSQLHELGIYLPFP